MDQSHVRRVLNDQDGVISRRQLTEAGATHGDVERLVRQRELVRLLPRVYLNHTGEATWIQRAWAGCLWGGPAVLAGPSSLRAIQGPGRRDHDDRGAIHLLVDHRRTLTAPPGFVVHRSRSFDQVARWVPGPPRVRLEHAVIEVASLAPGELDAIHALADACRSRRTTPDRLLAALDSRSRLPRRSWLRDVLADVAQGACSVLEQGYLARVERCHGLPGGDRQVRERTAGGVVHRDVQYAIAGLLVELDGRLHAESAQRDKDLDRDLVAAVDGSETVRLGWGQVFARPCRTAYLLGELFRRRGWGGQPTACGTTCDISSAP